MDQQRIGQFIQEQRKAHGMTQQDLADKLGVTNKAVSKWEKGIFDTHQITSRLRLTCGKVDLQLC